MPRRVTYGLTAAALSVGAPLGLLAVRALGSPRPTLAWARRELSGDWSTYLYLAVSTTIVFLLFGYVLGRQADRLLELAQTDALTGLRNARVFAGRLHEEVARAARYGQPLSLLMIDVDGLKDVNDRLGHHAGDQALRRIAAVIRQEARATDVAARWGGDEFALLAPATAAADGCRLAERVRALAAESAGAAGLPLTVSIGVASTDAAQATPGQLRDRADAALYAAKRQGRNRVACG